MVCNVELIPERWYEKYTFQKQTSRNMIKMEQIVFLSKVGHIPYFS